MAARKKKMTYTAADVREGDGFSSGRSWYQFTKVGEKVSFTGMKGPDRWDEFDSYSSVHNDYDTIGTVVNYLNNGNWQLRIRTGEYPIF